VSDCAVECRIVRGDSVGDAAVNPDLWGFCGDAGRDGSGSRSLKTVRLGWFDREKAKTLA
jgi:hypothetical protein